MLTHKLKPYSGVFFWVSVFRTFENIKTKAMVLVIAKNEYEGEFHFLILHTKILILKCLYLAK